MPAANTLEKLLARAEVGAADECWPWTGALKNGYGYASYHRRHVQAHRIIYELVTGNAVPQELDLDHLCRVRACVNLAHLEPVTRRVNVERGIGLAAENMRKTECINGHEFTEENTRIGRTRGGHPTRVCRTCDLDAQRRYQARRRAS